jgi:hypothetical protein
MPPEHVYVTHSWFGVTDQGELPFETGTWANGLVSVMAVGARIHTGIDTGNVNVATSMLNARPEEVDPDSWDEIVDVSIFSRHGLLRVDSPQTGFVDSLPVLSFQGPGSYRLRVHARGRDIAHRQVKEVSAEQYLLTIWPEEPSPEVIIRLTDYCGYCTRLSNSRSEKNRSSPQQSPSSDRKQHEDKLRQAILEGIKNTPPKHQ